MKVRTPSEATRQANLLAKPTIDECAKLIDRQWARAEIAMDWLGMEATLRVILNSPEIPPGMKVVLAKETIAAFTRR